MTPTALASKKIKDLKLNPKLNAKLIKVFFNTIRHNELTLMTNFIVVGFNVNAKGPYDQTALMIAALNGNTQAVTLLLAAPGILVNEQSKNGATALIIAASKGHVEIVDALLRAGDIDVNLLSKNGLTALMLAVTHGHTKVVEALLAFPSIQANVTTHTSAMALAIQYNRPIIFLLLNHVDQSAKAMVTEAVLSPPPKTVILSTVQTPNPLSPRQTANSANQEEDVDTSALRFAIQQFNPYRKL